MADNTPSQVQIDEHFNQYQQQINEFRLLQSQQHGELVAMLKQLQLQSQATLLHRPTSEETSSGDSSAETIPLHQKPILITGHDCRTRLYHLEAIDENPDCLMEDDNDEILEDTSTETLGDKPAEISFPALVGQQNPSTIPLTRVQAMQHWTWPSSLKHLCGFVGLTGYYRQFIRHYATVASPLTDLLQKDAFPWSSEAQKAFAHSKKCLRTMFEALYGRKPPTIPLYNSGSSSIEAGEDDLPQRDQILIRLKYTLHQSQARMSCLADQKRLDKQLEVGSWVLLQFQPYRQHFLVRRTFQKRSKKYYGPYEIKATIRKGSYKLTLPEGSQILPVFHISLLKPYYGPPPQAVCQLPTLSINNQPLISSLTIVGERTVLNNDKPIQQVLVQWHGLLPEDTTWENLHELQLEFSALNLEDKVILHGVGNDRSLHQGLTSEPESNQGIEEMNGDQVDNIQRRAQRKPMWMGDYVMNQLK
ncbi:uncharacterized protein LOC143890899 isoform X2 [Tasmannia lanceolata]|uniref:uncharacterized protein LOC143890899 isoform X2 n=1 Tax=Tasmannia lanceolata TaxID=3420 RepID=UPI004064490D